ncbi:MAG: hypothetical protein AAF492_00335 [Verrucomicrobiota bacterium]
MKKRRRIGWSVIAAWGLFISTVPAVEILYESFESPPASGYNNVAATGWTLAGTVTRAYLVDTNTPPLTGAQGNQAAAFKSYNGQGAMQTTPSILHANLMPHIRYTLTFNAAESGGGTHEVIADLFAGSTVIESVTIDVSSINKNLGTMTGTLQFIPLADHPNLGEPLSIRLAVGEGSWNQYVYVDNLSLDATDTSTDTDAPMPNPPVWSAVPAPDVNNGINMQSVFAADPNGVQYFFSNTVSGTVSGWQDSPIWTDPLLLPDATYSYRFKVRDRSANQNETGWSSEEIATTDPHLILFESFEEPILNVLPARPTTKEWGSNPDTTPEGWVRYAGRTYTKNEDDWRNITTPFGEQVMHSFRAAGDPPNYRQEAIDIPAVLELGTTYELSFNVGNVHSDNGNTSSSIGFGAAILAGTNIVASTNGVSTSNKDMSDARAMTFVPNPGTLGLGEAVRVRFWMTSGDWRYQPLFDNIRLRAVSPPRGTLIFGRCCRS